MLYKHTILHKRGKTKTKKRILYEKLTNHNFQNQQ
jgi:hypothetical protein